MFLLFYRSTQTTGLWAWAGACRLLELHQLTACSPERKRFPSVRRAGPGTARHCFPGEWPALLTFCPPTQVLLVLRGARNLRYLLKQKVVHLQPNRTKVHRQAVWVRGQLVFLFFWSRCILWSQDYARPTIAPRVP